MAKGFKCIGGLVVLTFLVLSFSACGSEAGLVKPAEIVVASEAATSDIPVTTAMTSDNLDDSSIEISPSFSPKFMIGKFGKPDKQEDLLGCTIMTYGDNEFSFVEDNLTHSVVRDLNIAGPQGIKRGDHIAKAIRLYGIPESIALAGISISDSDEVILQKLKSKIDPMIYYSGITFENKDKWALKLDHDLETGRIGSFTIQMGFADNSLVLIDSDDFDKSPRALIKKFGLPKKIQIYGNNDSVILDYDGNMGAIICLNAKGVHTNSFGNKENWSVKNLVNLQALQRPSDQLPLYPYPMVSNGYHVEIITERDGSVRYDSIAMMDYPKVALPGEPLDFKIPTFDPKAVASVDDMYLSGLRLSISRRAEVFALFGQPIYAVAGFQEDTSKFQDCTFEKGNAKFLDIVEYDDYSTGRAMSLSTRDPKIIGPRGLRVGDSIERFWDVFPRKAGVEFKAISKNESVQIYYYDATPGEGQDYCEVSPDSQNSYSGRINFTIDWYMFIGIEYEKGIITEIDLNMMLD